MNDNTKLANFSESDSSVKEETALAMSTIREYLSTYTLNDHKDILWSLLLASTTNESDDLYKPSDVAVWLTYYKQFEMLVDALSTLEKDGRFNMPYTGRIEAKKVDQFCEQKYENAERTIPHGR